MKASSFSRRAFLTMVGITGAAATPIVRSIAGAHPSTQNAARWSDPRVWGGKTPGASDVAVVSRTVVIDKNTSVAGVVVAPGGKLVFNRNKSVTLTSRGNVVVRGRLVMRPRRSKKHKLVFNGVNESAFVGKGMSPTNTDVGLWVMGSGRLVIVGARRKAWSRGTGAVPVGARSIELKGKPNGWRRSDNIVLTPTSTPTDKDHYTRFDNTTINSIDGKRVRLSVPTSFAHPSVQGGTRTFTAEVLNLTRNVVIQGTPRGRSHIFIRSNRPQRIRHCLIQHMGPRKDELKILGRWPLHFHHCGGGSRRSVVEGVVVRNSGSHAFVAHASNGVTFRDCVAYDVVETPFWWDQEPDSGTLDATYIRCVAAKCMRGNANVSGFAAFRGRGNRMRNCVAVGIDNRLDTSGAFVWPGSSNEGFWDQASNLVAHNNRGPGIRFWSNSDIRHHIDPGSAFYNNSIGILHGAYGNVATYDGIVSAGNSGFDTKFHARTPASADERQRWTNSYLGKVLVEMNIGKASTPIFVKDCDLDCITVHSKNSAPLGFADFVGCTIKGRDVASGDVSWERAPVGGALRFKRRDGTCWKYEMTNEGPRVVDPIPDFE
jgi:hypothetical protein